ncbi:MAG: EthD domain-containing protein [Stagnimonas sp.]|nr:EthD domain-containing protein [Stagnimonas sp.]
MEKVIYVVWRDPAVDIEEFGARLRKTLAPRLKTLGARGLRINVADHHVAPAAAIAQKHSEPPVQALVQVWLHSANAALRAPVDAAIAGVAARFDAYLVTESVPLPNVEHESSGHGQRTEGFAQIALFPRKPGLGDEDFLDLWQNRHTTVAVETQSNFEYLQNRVVRALTPGARAIDAIVEESFPTGAMTDPQLFFDAEGDPAKFEKNLKAMMDSVGRFIDMSRIDVTPTSQYCMF